MCAPCSPHHPGGSLESTLTATQHTLAADSSLTQYPKYPRRDGAGGSGQWDDRPHLKTGETSEAGQTNFFIGSTGLKAAQIPRSRGR
jgi:hypothetical protein